MQSSRLIERYFLFYIASIAVDSMSIRYWLARFLNVVILNRAWSWFQKILTRWKKHLFKEQTLLSASSIDTQKRSLADHQSKRMTRFDDLPDELLLVICRYLSPAHVLNAFLDYDSRTFRCIFDYRTNINLTKWSYTDLQSILAAIDSKRLLPSVLTLSNYLISTQIEHLLSEKSSLKLSCLEHVHRLSMLDCTLSDILSLYQILPNFTRLHSLRIVDCASNNYRSDIISHLSDWLRDLIFDLVLDAPLTTIELVVDIGITLSKQIAANERLTRLTLSLKTIDDLLVLINGLAPNLTTLDVTLCNARVSSRSLLPPRWPRRPMAHLTEFRLTTKENVELKLEYLRGIVMALGQLDTLSLAVKKWTSDDGRFAQGNQIETIIDEYLPLLRYLYCNIQTMCDVDMKVTFICQMSFPSHFFFSSKTFVGLNRRWPMACRTAPMSSCRYLYTVPWPFK